MSGSHPSHLCLSLRKQNFLWFSLCVFLSHKWPHVMLWTAAREEGSWSPAVLPTAAWGSLWDLCASEMGILNFSAGKSCRVSQYKAKLEFIQKRLQHQFKPVLRKKEGHSRKDGTHPRHGSKLKSLARGPYQSLLPMATFCLVQRLLWNVYLFICVPSVNETRDGFLRSPGQEYRLERRQQGPKASTEFFLG